MAFPRSPIHIAVLLADEATLFVAVEYINTIRQVDVASGVVTTLAGSGAAGSADGVGTAAEFHHPHGLALSADGATLFVSDRRNHKIRQVDVSTAVVTSLAGSGVGGSADGVGTAAEFDVPIGLALSVDGTTLFVADCFNHKIRQMNVSTAVVTTLAGSGARGSADGVGEAAEFNNPGSLALSVDGTTLFVVYEGKDVRMISAVQQQYPSDDRKVAQRAQGLGALPKVDTLAKVDAAKSVAVGHDGAELIVSCYRSVGLKRIRLRKTARELISIPPSTLASDCRKMGGDKDLPTGLVCFIVGLEQHRIEHIAKPMLSVRSEYFFNMFRGGLGDHSGDTITVPDANPAAFQSFIDYLLSDNATIDVNTGHAWGVMELARKYQVKRLELLCLSAIEDSLGPQNAIQLLEGAHTTYNERLFAQCRQYITDHSAEVKRSSGLEELQALGIAKGLLGDSIDRCAHFEHQCEQSKKHCERWMQQCDKLQNEIWERELNELE